MTNNKEESRLKDLYEKMMSAYHAGNDVYSFECANEIWHSWYFQLFTGEARDAVEWILTVNKPDNNLDLLA